MGCLILSMLLAAKSVQHRPMPQPDDPFVAVKDTTSPLHMRLKASPDGLLPDSARP